MKLLSAILLLLLVTPAPAQQTLQLGLVEAKRALALKDFPHARDLFLAFLNKHPDDPQAELGLADAHLGLHQYEAAETLYRRIVAQQPLLWQAHKNLIVTEAALGRWDDFNSERAVLHGARQRGAAGISPHDSDVIDVITAHGQRWIVRDYFEPSGRSRARYNFERFDASGHVLAYVSFESADAFANLHPGDAVAIGPAAAPTEMHGFALNVYTGKAHSTIRRYATEPNYQALRAEFLRWLRTQPVGA